MSGTLFSKVTPRHDGPQPLHVATSNEPQGGGSAPPLSQGGWLCDEPYKYTVKASKNPLEICNEVLERQDENIYRQMKEEINFLMVVAGLFLAIVAAFAVESYKFLQEDKQDTMSDLLVEVVRLLNDTNAQGKAQLPKSFAPNHHALVVNNLWFLSMILDLIAVAIGTFCLQWISAISRGSDLTEKSIPPHKSLALRQLRREGLVGWGVLYAPEALLFMVQLSIGLFTCGLVYFLWNINKAIAIPVLVAACLTGGLLYLINILPFLQSLVGAFIPATLSIPECPYKSPTSWLIQSAGSLLLYILKLFLNLLLRDWVRIVGRPGRWLESLPLPFTDFKWKKYDAICQDLRECVRPRLSYFQSGLLSALDHFLDEREVMNIISGYLETLVPFFATTDDWEMFSQQNLSKDEKSFLNGNNRIAYHRLPRRLNIDTVRLQLEHAKRIKVDFISALVLQQLTRHNERLSRLSLRHRAELYIRVKNSTKLILNGDESLPDFGRSLDCPFQAHDNFEELDLELRFQFLRCVKHLLDVRRFTDLDIMSASAIILCETATVVGFRTQRPSDTQRLTDEEGLEGLHTAPSSQTRDLGKKVDHGMASSLPKHSEKDNSQSTAHTTSAEDPEPMDSVTILCAQVLEQLFKLRPSDFKDLNYYRKLRTDFGLSIEPIPPAVTQDV